VLTSNREPIEWLTMTSDARLAQSAVDGYTSAVHTLFIEGPSYRASAFRPARSRHAGARGCQKSHETRAWVHVGDQGRKSRACWRPRTLPAHPHLC